MDFTAVNHSGGLVFHTLRQEVAMKECVENSHWILPVSDLRSGNGCPAEQTTKPKQPCDTHLLSDVEKQLVAVCNRLVMRMHFCG
jgi:hypothetical protein